MEPVVGVCGTLVNLVGRQKPKVLGMAANTVELGPPEFPEFGVVPGSMAAAPVRQIRLADSGHCEGIGGRRNRWDKSEKPWNIMERKLSHFFG